MRFSFRSLLGALATAFVASTAAAQVRPPTPPVVPPASPAPNDSARRAGATPAVPSVRPPVDTTGRRRTPADSVPLPPPSRVAPAPAIVPARPRGADTTRADSLRADSLRARRGTLARDTLARDTTARDTTARVAPLPGDSAGPRRARGDTTANPLGDLDVQFQGRMETKLERTHNDRCGRGQTVAFAFGCRSGFQPDLTFQFGIRSNGSVADRVHVNVDYDSQREFDASNTISLFYESKRPDARVGRFEIGNVTFAPAASRFITAGIPSNNYGAQAEGHVGPMRWRAIAAQQRGNVTRDRVFTVGTRASQTIERPIDDFQIEPRRFFWTVNPRLLGGYPNVDVLDRARLASLAASLPDTLRPARLVVYRQLVGAAYQNPRGPRLQVRGARNASPQTYEVLREGVDYYVDPSLLWIALVRPLGLNNERLAVAYEVNIGGRRARWISTGGTPDLERTTGDQLANLIWEPELAPSDSAFAREMRNVYRVGGEDMRRETVGVRIVAGVGDQEKPADASLGATYLQLFGLAERTSPTTFDVENRLWPRPQDPNVGQAGGTLGGKLLRDYFIVFPSQQPFARDGGVRRTANPSNDTLYTFPSEFLYSAQRPQSIYRLRLRYESEGGPDTASIALGSLQIRPGSERLTALGRALVRDVDYRIDYDLGTVTFTEPAALFPTPTGVTVRFEENPVFVTQPTTVFGAAAEFPTSAGLVYLTAISQSQKSALFNRPPLGFEGAGSTVAGVGADLSWDAPVLARAAARITQWSRGPRLAGDTTPVPTARISVRGEFAASKPHASASQQAYLETFEGEGGLSLPINDGAWYYGSRPPSSGALGRALGTPLTLDRAATLAWQSNVTPLGGRTSVQYSITQIDPAVRLQGSGFDTPESVFWLTLYPLRVGGLPNTTATPPSFRWTVANTPAGRRWRSIRTVLNPSGADLSRVEDLEFYALVYGPDDARRGRNPTLVFDFGDLSENSVAFAPETLTVASRAAGATTVDSTYTGRRLAGFNRLDTERDTLSRVFNAQENDVGLPGDRADSLVVVSPGAPTQRVDSVALCRATLGGIRTLGDPGTNCTVQNGRLDEEDIDQDGQLNLTDAQADRERLRRFVIDLSDPRTVSRAGGCVDVPTGLGDLVAGGTAPTVADRKCWVFVRVPFRSPSDSLNGFNARRVRTARLTVVSAAAQPDDAATTLALARIRLTGAPWLRRTDRAATGIGGDSTGTPASFVVAGSIGTQDATARVPYEPPPGVTETTDEQRTGAEPTQVQVNERSLRLQTGVVGGELARYERAEAYLRFPEGAKNFMTYRQLRLWARGQGHGWGPNGDLEMFVKIGRDESNFYLYHTAANAGTDRNAWLPEVRVDLEQFYRLRVALQESLLPGGGAAPSRYPCTGVDAELVRRSGLPRGIPVNRVAACSNGYMVYTVDGNVTPPNLAAVQELAVGIVRVNDAHRGADAIVPNDTLELWVDDVRLGNAEASAGMAGEIGLGVHFGDLADVRVNLTRRDPSFRQLGEAPTFVTAGIAEIGASIRVDRLLPRWLGLALPLTITHTSVDAAPLFVANTDLRGEDLAGLRAPREAATSWALTVRRATPSHGTLAPLLDNLSLTSTYVAGRTRSTYQDAARHAFSVRADYDLAPTARTLAALGGVRWSPTTLRLTSHLARTGDRQAAFLGPIASPLDSARVVTGLDHVWEHGATVELRPLPSLTARWDASTLRDLRPSLQAAAARDSVFDTAFRADRSRVGVLDLGFERQRVMTGGLSWAPGTRSARTWVRPRADVSTTYAMTRDPNAPSLVSDVLGLPNVSLDSLTGRLPRRIGATELLSAGATLDVSRALYGDRVGHDSATRARAPWITRLLQPVDVGASRTLSSSFDATAADPGLGTQLGLSGIGGLRAIDGRAATLAGVVDRVTVSQTFVLPFGLALTNRAEAGGTRSWWRRASTGDVAEGRGILRTAPDLTLRWAWRPAAGAMVSNIGGSARMLRQRQTAIAPADSLAPEDARATLLQTWPVTGTVTWAALGGLTTSGGLTLARRTDDVPGSRTASNTRDASAEATRSFKPPSRWGLKSDILGRIGWQDSRTRTLVNGRSDFAALPSFDLLDPFSRIVQADLGRRSLSFGANSSVAENMTLGLTGTHVTTFNRNFGTQITQTVLSAVLQVNFFSSSFH